MVTHQHKAACQGQRAQAGRQADLHEHTFISVQTLMTYACVCTCICVCCSYPCACTCAQTWVYARGHLHTPVGVGLQHAQRACFNVNDHVCVCVRALQLVLEAVHTCMLATKLLGLQHLLGQSLAEGHASTAHLICLVKQNHAHTHLVLSKWAKHAIGPTQVCQACFWPCPGVPNTL